MTISARLSTAPPREDIVISLCFPETGAEQATRCDEQHAERLKAIINQLLTHFQYVETIFVVTTTESEQSQNYLNGKIESRVIIVRPDISHYRKRATAITEAIGDIVIVTSLDEAERLDLPALVEKALSKDSIITARRTGRTSLLYPLIKTLGTSAGFRVDIREGTTTIYPRRALNIISTNPDPILSLRFPPNDDRLAIETVLIDNVPKTRRSLSMFKRRLVMLNQLLINSAQGLLIFLGLCGAATSLGGLLLILYAIGAFLLADQIVQGWFTTMVALGGVAFVLGMTLFGISTAIARVIALLSTKPIDDVVTELGTTPVFASALKRMNVETERDSRDSP